MKFGVEPVCDQLRTSSEHVASVMEFGFTELECGPMPNVMAALPNVGGVLCSTPQTLTDAHYLSAVQ